jgi:hypothetical protein
MIFLVIIKKVKLRYFFSLALRFFNRAVIVRASFSALKFGKHQNFAFALSKFLGILSSLFSPLQTWQISKLAFAFS